MTVQKLSTNQAQALQQVGKSEQQPTTPFQLFLDQAIDNNGKYVRLDALPVPNYNQSLPMTRQAEMIAQVLNQTELDDLDTKRRRDRADDEVLFTPENINELGIRNNRLDVTPFQHFIDKAVEALENVSQQEFKVNDLIDQYIAGDVSIDEVSIETTKLNLAISFATTVVTTAQQTFKELTQMPI